MLKKYLGGFINGGGGGHTTFKFEKWTDSTRELQPRENKFGYNIDKNRLEFYIESLDKWFYLWSEFIAITEEPVAPYFSENFETMWFIQNNFIQIFQDLFEDNWFIDNLFNQLFIETFEGDW